MVASLRVALLDGLRPKTRTLLVRERIRAMQAGFDEAIQRLADGAQTILPESPQDALALRMLRAELLHLHRLDHDALSYFKEQVLPLASSLRPIEKLAVEQNLADLEFVIPQQGFQESFSSLVDRKRVVGVEWLDAQDALEAREAAAAGEHYKSLPIAWRQAIRSYSQGAWISSRWASKLLALECLALGELREAAHHAFTCGSEKDLAGKIGDAILQRRDKRLVLSVLCHLYQNANLRRHFVIAAEIVGHIADAIPPTQLPTVTEWLLARCAELPVGGYMGLEPQKGRGQAECLGPPREALRQGASGCPVNT